MTNVIDRLKIPLGDYPATGEPFTAMVATDRQAIVDLLDESNVFEITMPCGYSKKFEEHTDIPYDDLPCPCGGFNCYLIRYERSK